MDDAVHEAAGVEVEGGHGVDVVHGHGAVVVHQHHPALGPGDRAQTRAYGTSPSHIVASSRLELETNLRKSFHNHIEDPYTYIFQPSFNQEKALVVAFSVIAKTSPKVRCELWCARLRAATCA